MTRQPSPLTNSMSEFLIEQPQNQATCQKVPVPLATCQAQKIAPINCCQLALDQSKKVGAAKARKLAQQNGAQIICWRMRFELLFFPSATFEDNKTSKDGINLKCSKILRFPTMIFLSFYFSGYILGFEIKLEKLKKY